MAELVNIRLEEKTGQVVYMRRDREKPELDETGAFELEGRRWRWSHTYLERDRGRGRPGTTTIYKCARPADTAA